MRAYHCSHRVELVVTPICYCWPDGTPLEPSVRKVSCPSCKKQWAVGLTREQHTRLARMRKPGDRRSPYELGPPLTARDTMNCAVCGAAVFEHHGYAGWLCPGYAVHGAEAYEEAQGLGEGTD